MVRLIMGANGAGKTKMCIRDRLYGAAALLPDLLPESAAEQADKRRAWFLLLLGVCAVPAGWTVMGFSPAAVLTAVLLLYFVGRGPVPDAAAAGALAGLTLDLCGTGCLLYTSRCV